LRIARLTPFTTTMGSGISGSIPENLVARFFTSRVILRATFRAPVALAFGFARLVRGLAGDDLPRDLAAADLVRADVAFAGFARDLTAADFARRDAGLVLARLVLARRDAVAALRAGWAAFLAVDRRTDFFFATGICSSHLNIDDNLLKRRIGRFSSPHVCELAGNSSSDRDASIAGDPVFIPHQ
jgi:hypothetical protein